MTSRWVPLVIALLLPVLIGAGPAPTTDRGAVEAPLRYTGLRSGPAAESEAAHPAAGWLLAYDPTGGRIVEVFGDLHATRHVAVLVPGNGHTLVNYAQDAPHGLRRSARALFTELTRRAPDAPIAVVAWLGYTPSTSAVDVESARSELAAAAAPNLIRLTHALPADARLTLVCHSYGSVICGHAAANARADAIVALASPGMDTASAADLDTSADIYAARAAGDPIAYAPNVRLGGFGHGTDPTTPGFGATVFATGDITGHSRYYEPGSESLANIARVVLGRTAEITGGHRS